MAFISMMFAGVVLIIVIIGFFALLLGGLLDLIWIIRAVFKKKTHIIFKVFAVFISLAGIFMFVLPVAGISLLGKLSQHDANKRFEQAEYKVYLEEGQSLNEGFVYKEKQLVLLENMQAPKSEKLTEEGVLIKPSGEKVYINSVKNEGNFPIYFIVNYGLLFCNEDQLEEIVAYYHDPAHLTTEISYSVGEEQISKKVDLSGDIVARIRDVYDNHTNEGSCSGMDDEFKYLCIITTYTEDHLYYDLVDLHEYKDRIVLSWTSGGGGETALYLPKELEDEIREKILPLISQ